MNTPSQSQQSGRGVGATWRRSSPFLPSVLVGLFILVLVMGFGVYTFHSQLPEAHLSVLNRNFKMKSIAVGEALTSPQIHLAVPSVAEHSPKTEIISSAASPSLRASPSGANQVKGAVQSPKAALAPALGVGVAVPVLKKAANVPRIAVAPAPKRPPYLANTSVSGALFRRDRDPWIGWQGQWPIGNGYLVSIQVNLKFVHACIGFLRSLYFLFLCVGRSRGRYV